MVNLPRICSVSGEVRCWARGWQQSVLISPHELCIFSSLYIYRGVTDRLWWEPGIQPGSFQCRWGREGKEMVGKTWKGRQRHGLTGQ